MRSLTDADDRRLREDRDLGDRHALAADLATALMTIEEVPNIALFRKNTAAFVHDMPPETLSNVDGDSTYVRVQVLTNAGALDRTKQSDHDLQAKGVCDGGFDRVA